MESATTTNTKRDREFESLSSTHNPSMDSFLASMTFAGTGSDLPRVGCDCDECGGAGGLLPQTIIDAIRKHKKLKAEFGPMKRTQQRQLVKRQGTISAYQFTLPLDSEPLVEFGSTHRLVWIQRLDASSRLLSIGKGIVGSQDEERGRQELKEWKQGAVFLVPSNGGKAVAWIHGRSGGSSNDAASGKEDTKTQESAEKKKPPTKDDSSNEPPKQEEKQKDTAASGGHAILYICKIPKESLHDTMTAEEEESQKEWHEIVRETCKNALDNFQNQNPENDKGMQYQQLSSERAGRLREALLNLS